MSVTMFLSNGSAKNKGGENKDIFTWAEEGEKTR